MSWTTPRTWVAGEIVTAAIMNTHVRDNFGALNQAVQVHLSVNGTHSASGSFQTISGWDAEDFDTNSLHDNVTNPSRLTAPMAGDYLAWGQVAFNAAGAASIGARISKNGAAVFDNRVPSANTNGNVASITLAVAMNAGDYLELAGLQSSGGSLTILGGSGGSSSFFGMKLIGA